ncbi:MAG: DUF6807 family protein, partial [Bacteroidota bacterium]
MLKLLSMRTFIPYLFIFLFLAACGNDIQKQKQEASLSIKKSKDGFTIFFQEQKLLSQIAQADFRPYLHPIMAPDGKGSLTQYSPGHHRHQTGLYWGFTRVNGTEVNPDSLLSFFYNREKSPEQQSMVGRDFFHHPGEAYW